MMPEHTKGPLVAHKNPTDRGARWWIMRERRPGSFDSVGSAGREGDARLWAEAPAMLEALRGFLATADVKVAKGYTGLGKARESARAILARIEGGE